MAELQRQRELAGGSRDQQAPPEAAALLSVPLEVSSQQSQWDALLLPPSLWNPDTIWTAVLEDEVIRGDLEKPRPQQVLGLFPSIDQCHSESCLKSSVSFRELPEKSGT